MIKGLMRLIDKRMAAIKATVESLIDLGEASGVSGSAGAVPTCTVDGDDADVFEPYGLAGQAASGDALVFAPEGDSDSLTALLSSVAGRPATEPGDKALWTAAGHVIYLDNDGGLTITSKDGSVITMEASGSIVIAVAGGQTIKLGDVTAMLGVARQTDSVGAATAMAIWIAGVQAICTAAAPLLALPVPVAPSDFGIITSSSTTTLSK
jgi:phage gp45-like